MDELPGYMQLFYQTILNVFEEFEAETTEEERYRVHNVKEAVKIFNHLINILQLFIRILILVVKTNPR